MQNRKTEANLAENGRGQSAQAQFQLGDGKAARLGMDRSVWPMQNVVFPLTDD